MQLVATFSSGASGTMVAVSDRDNPAADPAIARPPLDAAPLDVLADLGYQLAHPSQAYHSLGSTMLRTSYASLLVIPI